MDVQCRITAAENDFLVWMSRKMHWSKVGRVLIAACVAVACIPDEPGVPSGAEPLELRGFPDEIVAEQVSASSAPERMVIRDVENWQEFWDILYPTTTEKPPLPAVELM